MRKSSKSVNWGISTNNHHDYERIQLSNLGESNKNNPPPHRETRKESRQITRRRMWNLEKIGGDLYPRCGLRALAIYYEDETDLQLGARCEEFALKGFFMNGKLVQVAIA
jgi:hypothetical protein